tara:strand:- start:363 stop:887 length:525 start_codon:yes stop_codon:yes gene_type:complete
MQGTDISQINYDNNENAKLIEEALKETEVLDFENQQPEPQQIMPQQQQPLQQPYQQQQPQYQQPTQPSPFQQQYQQPPQQYQQQYQQPPPHQQQEPQYKQPEQSEMFSSSVLNNLKHSLILMILLFLLNNKVFKDIIGQLPFTMDEDGDANIFLTMVLCLVITFSYSIYLQIFN